VPLRSRVVPAPAVDDDDQCAANPYPYGLRGQPNLLIMVASPQADGQEPSPVPEGSQIIPSRAGSLQ